MAKRLACAVFVLCSFLVVFLTETFPRYLSFNNPTSLSTATPDVPSGALAVLAVTEHQQKERASASLFYSESQNPFPLPRDAGLRLFMGGWKVKDIARFSSTPLAKQRVNEATVMFRVVEGVCLSRGALMRISEEPPAFPLHHLALLCVHGFSEDDVLRIVAAHRRYEETQAFRRLSGKWRDILEKDMYHLAQYVSIVSGDGIDPALIVGVVEEESRRGRFLGSCFYFPSQKVESPLRSIPGEAEAFKKIVAGINSTRNPRYRMPVSYPAVSCPGETGFGGAMGFVQMLPSVWLAYEPEIREVMGKKEFVDPYSMVPAFHGLAMYLRDNASFFHTLPRDVSVSDSKTCNGLAARYYAGRRWKMHVGEYEYGWRVCAEAQSVASRF